MQMQIVRPVFLACAFAVPIAAQVQPAAPQIKLRVGSFDPLLSKPETSELLRSTNEQGLWILQFHQTPSQADRDAIATLGGQVIGYLPDNAYVVRMQPATAANALSIATVRWVGSYEVSYRIDPELLAKRVYESEAPVRYNIVVADKHADKPMLLAKIAAVGGRVEDLHFGSILIDATLTGPQLLLVAGCDEVLWIDAWSAPDVDMDNARIQGGGNYVEAQAGYTGAGVNAHVYEGIEATHPDFTGGAINVQSAGGAEQHGHATGGIVWGNGTSNPAVRGMAPDCGKFFTEYNTVTASRWQVFSDLVNVHNVSHSSASWGGGRTFFYTASSAESDDIVFDHNLTWTQSQSNAGNQDSRPQAWAKNVFSIGGVNHNDDANPLNDSWQNGGASIGPASDGRIKPDMTAYYDNTGTSDLTGAAGYSSGNWTSSFGGTSGATPIVAGHNVLAIQMFTDDTGTPGVGPFGNALRLPGGTVHENRPHFTTLKALQIVNGNQYSFSSTSTDNRREHQGWGGFPSLQNMWDNRGKTFIVDETSVLSPGAADAWQITVAPNEPELRVCLHWNEPAGNPSAAQHLVNNLSLRVRAPNGTEYWGNAGLQAGVWSVLGGSEDLINSVENVFVQNPVAGDWYVQVFARSVVMDNHVETPAVDADYGLVCVGGPGQAAPSGFFAEVESIGFGCDGSTCVDAIYEYPTFSLANSSITFEHVGADYVLQPGQGTWIPAAGQNLGMADNTEVVKNLAFTLAYPGGSTSSLRVCSNGWISSGFFTGTSNLVPDPDDFLAQTMWAPLWHDLNPGAGGSVWFDSTSQRAVVTWVAVPNFFNSGASTFQAQFWANGDVHFIYQNITVAGDYLTGFSRTTSNDPGSSNLAAAAGSGVGVCTTLQPELRFDVSGRPVLGTTFDLVTTEIPAGTYFGLAILSTTQLPAVSLTFLGLPGCQLYQTIDVSVLWAQVGNSGIVQWPLPNNPALAGFEAFCQSATLTPGINAFGMAVSNGLKLVVGFN
ncbi:MAG: serine protease AprX [Planctomycetota bacterium]|jgi:serine protease AprX